MSRVRDLLPTVGTVASPAVAQALVYATSDGGAVGLFQADLVALVVVVAVAAFALRVDRRSALLLAIQAGIVGVVHIGLRADLDGTQWMVLLVLACGFVASGVAGLGRAIGAGRVASGAVASGLLWLAMTGLFWADDVSAELPPDRQRTMKQAVLHTDIATACAYDAAMLDRMHEPDIYADVPLASTLMGRPSARDTGLLWLGVGWIFWLAALALGRVGRGRPTDGDDA